MNPTRDHLNLAGQWRFALDPNAQGIRERWYARDLQDTIPLPGTTDQAEKGELTNERCTDRLSRVWRWIGPAWYQKTVAIPAEWAGKRIALFLERTKDSQVWVDETWMGSDDSLSTPHHVDLSDALTPGNHTITILVDNAKLPPVGPCHQVDERTQTNWNGIVGRIELIVTDKLWIDDLQAYPDPGNARVRLAGRIGNSTAWTGEARVTLRAEAIGQPALQVPNPRIELPVTGPDTPFEYELQLPENTPRWDEFDRSLLQLEAHLEAIRPKADLRDSQIVRFGLRSFRAERAQFVVNGRPSFLRGKNDCALFPLTGYAPMETAEWRRLLSIARDYGINHYRFHSWCPPEAAFAAADEVGIYFQVELPNKRGITEADNRDYKPPREAYETLAELEGDGGPPAVRTAYLTREGERILAAYGNHPSFAMLTLGNELGGDEGVMRGLCDHFRAVDDRHLYAMGTGHFHWDLGLREGDEFWVTRATAPGRTIRGASWEQECHIDHKPPSTTVDYREALQGVPVPVVAHEMAQYETFPDFQETAKYTGVLKAHNFEIFRERLETAGMLDQAVDFLRASGAISTICHREDVEAALRTPGLAGFQMLDLQDFSGQGTALIGLLNVFMESKGLITPEDWREFCCETVPLLWMTTYTWTSDETFRAGIRVAHYGPARFADQCILWEVSDGSARLAHGRTRAMDIPTGTVTEVDLLCADLSAIDRPRKLEVTLTVEGTNYRNRYPVWVYPAGLKPVAPHALLITREFTQKAAKALAAGRTVLLLPEPGQLENSVAMAFQSGFWSPMFRNKPGRLNPLGKETPGTQGILCDPDHPLFQDFPTESHTNWQWWHLVKNSRAMILDATPPEFRPIVQVIDGFDRNHKLGLILEARVGQGRLLVCSIDLPRLQGHPEARQLLHCIHNYADSDTCHPEHELDMDMIRKIIG